MDQQELQQVRENLKNILQNKVIENKHLEGASEEFNKLQEAFQYISQCIVDSQQYTTDIAKGKLEVSTLGNQNFLVGPTKELHSVLKHMTWQTQQVAKGDYNQRADFLGEYSESFNIMVDQLREAKEYYVLNASKQEKEKLKLSEIAYVDELTSAFNRRFGLNALHKKIEASEEFTLIMIDLNNLKVVNDTLGHKAGDEYICHTCDVIREMVREGDLLIRMGGDEFVLLLKYCKYEEAEDKMQQIATKIHNNPFAYDMSISYGLVYVDSQNEKTVEELLLIADEKMYAFKKIYKKRLRLDQNLNKIQ